MPAIARDAVLSPPQQLFCDPFRVAAPESTIKPRTTDSYQKGISPENECSSMYLAFFFGVDNIGRDLKHY
jgi:hypothetical protein